MSGHSRKKREPLSMGCYTMAVMLKIGVALLSDEDLTLDSEPAGGPYMTWPIDKIQTCIGCPVSGYSHEVARGPYIKSEPTSGCPIHVVSSDEWAFAQSANRFFLRKGRVAQSSESQIWVPTFARP